ncbi:MAG: hypothetical protein ACPLN0_01040 [Candidatus Hydrothermia bacterium]
MERFIFDTQQFKVCGIDENGYGPLLGPLVVTGVSMDVKGVDPLTACEIKGYRFPIPVKDSKEIFRRSEKSYAVGESIALTLLKAVSIEVDSLQEFLRKVCHYDNDLSAYGIEDLKIPAFGGKINYKLLDYLRVSGLILKEIHGEILMADKYNFYIENLGNKALLDLSCFVKVASRFNTELYLLGKIGGTTHYGRFFEDLGLSYSVIKESFSHSVYKIQNLGELHFIMNGDSLYVPITFAGIIGKYLRELVMQSLSVALGFKDPIPYASGYFHDERTYKIMDALPPELKNRWVRVK